MKTVMNRVHADLHTKTDLLTSARGYLFSTDSNLNTVE